MGKPHKHAELIKLWADGAEIQMKDGDVWKDIDPAWITWVEYRIKPDRKYPKSSLNDEELTDQYIHMPSTLTALRSVANAAIKRYIQDQEKENC